MQAILLSPSRVVFAGAAAKADREPSATREGRGEKGGKRGARMSSTSVSSGLTSFSSPRRVLNIAAYRKLWSGNLACRLRASSRSGEEESTSGGLSGVSRDT